MRREAEFVERTDRGGDGMRRGGDGERDVPWPYMVAMRR